MGLKPGANITVFLNSEHMIIDILSIKMQIVFSAHTAGG